MFLEYFIYDNNRTIITFWTPSLSNLYETSEGVVTRTFKLNSKETQYRRKEDEKTKIVETEIEIEIVLI